MVVQYLAKCALPSGTNLVKQDQNGNSFTFPGAMGLAPGYLSGACGKDCSEIISACMMAHINSSGTHIPLWMVTPDDGSAGWGTSPAFPTREGTFFGQIMVTNTQNNLDAYFCNGPGSDQNMVPGRLGINTQDSSVPYANAWPTSAGMDGLCETAAPQHVNNVPSNNYDHGRCTAHTTGGVIDGDSSCLLNGTTWSHPLTVWRGATYQAENAEGGAWQLNGNGQGCTPGQANCQWTKGGFGFQTGCTANTNGCAIIADSNNGMGARVGYISPSKGVMFRNVSSASSGSMTLAVYYTNGDPYTTERYLQFSVNGGAPQVKAFGGLLDWSHPHGGAIQLSGFNSGSSNTVSVTADPNDSAPDLDWIEIVDSGSTLPSTGFCDPAKWTITTNVSGSSGLSNLANGSNSARWTTGRGMQNGDYVQIDFGGNVTLGGYDGNGNVNAGISLDNSNDGSSGDYATTYAIYTSQDGSSFGGTAMMTGAGASNMTNLYFAPESVRAIRIQVTNARSAAWWSIGEVLTNCSLH
jgi:hypothetical protein